MTATATYHQFYCIDRENDVNRAMVVYRAMENDAVWPMHLVMDVTTGTRWVTSTPAGANEVVIHELTFDEKVDELLNSAIFTISNEADDRASHQLPSADDFNDVNTVMCEVMHELNEYGFKWYTCATAEQACELMDIDGTMVIEVTENGCHVFRG
nr:MAG TPA_asm: hypothetical protein [Caudoviricetes sp.]